MGRKRTSTAEDFVDLVALLPWWGGVSAAVAAYAVLHHFAVPPSTKGLQPGQMVQFVQGSLVYALANIGQYLVPFLCLVAAAVSYFRRRKRQQLARSVAAGEGPQSLERMTWREFEELVGEAFRMKGYAVTETGGGGADGGVDLVLRKDGKTYLVQCKQWKALTVPVTTVRELYGLMVHHAAAGGFVVTSGRFTAEAQAFARGKNIELVDGAELVARIKSAPVSVTAKLGADAAQKDGATPACPACGSTMVRRIARKGPRAGSAFWGCTRYPDCRGTR
jgi:restriction system protein